MTISETIAYLESKLSGVGGVEWKVEPLMYVPPEVSEDYERGFEDGVREREQSVTGVERTKP